MPFAKMQALGNDFVLLEETFLSALFGGQPVDDGKLSKIAVLLCNRHFGIGADGLIVLRQAQSQDCDLAWRFFNNDGSKSAMCGNGLRCLALYAQQNNLIKKNKFQIETEKGEIAVHFHNANQIEIDLGEPILESNRIPVAGDFRPLCVQETVKAGDTTFTATFVSMGNPHCVIFQAENERNRLAQHAAIIQSLPQFLQGVNVEFAYVESQNLVKVFVWERGVGQTLACASGAAATVVAGVLEGKLSRKAEVILPGGSLHVNFDEKDNHVRLVGPARLSYSGSVDLLQLLSEAANK